MKRLFILCFLAGIADASAQQAAPTTRQEYNLITEKYKVLEAEGRLDSRKDYEFRKFKTFTRDDRKVTVTELFRTGETKPCALMLMYVRERNEPHYICVPTPDAGAELWQKFYKETYPPESKKSDYKYSLIIYALAQYAMHLNHP